MLIIKRFIRIILFFFVSIIVSCGGGGGGGDSSKPSIDQMSKVIDDGATYYENLLSKGSSIENALTDTITNKVISKTPQVVILASEARRESL